MFFLFHLFQVLESLEKLKYELSGKYSRKIDKEHRIIYEVNEEEKVVYIYSLRVHYEKKK